MMRKRYWLLTFVVLVGLCGSGCSHICQQSSKREGLFVVQVGLEESSVFPLCPFLLGRAVAIDPDGNLDPVGAQLYVKGDCDASREISANYFVVTRVSWGEQYDQPNFRYYVIDCDDILGVYDTYKRLTQSKFAKLCLLCPPQEMNPAGSEGSTSAESEDSGGREE